MNYLGQITKTLSINSLGQATNKRMNNLTVSMVQYYLQFRRLNYNLNYFANKDRCAIVGFFILPATCTKSDDVTRSSFRFACAHNYDDNFHFMFSNSY